MHYGKTLFKKNFKSRLNVLKDRLELQNWTVEPVKKFFRLKSWNLGDFFELKFDVPFYEPLKIKTSVIVYSGMVEYIMKSFYPQNDKRVGPYVRHTFIEKISAENVQVPKQIEDSSHDSDEFFEYVLDIWQGQWEELQLRLNKYKDPEKLYLNALKYREAGKYYTTHPRILTLAKLINQGYYEKEVDIITKIIQSPNIREGDQEAKNRMQQIILYLDDFDAENYLAKRPWESVTEATTSEPIVTKEADPIYLENTAFIAISKDYSGNKLNALAKLLGGKILRKSGVVEVGDMARMRYNQAQEVDILQFSPNTIVFIHDPTILDRFDMKKASSKGEALMVMTELQTTNSVMISYYRNGKPVYEHMSNDGKIIEDESADGFDRGDIEVTIFIDQLFEQVTGRRYQDIRSDEEGNTYELS